MVIGGSLPGRMWTVLSSILRKGFGTFSSWFLRWCGRRGITRFPINHNFLFVLSFNDQGRVQKMVYYQSILDGLGAGQLGSLSCGSLF